MFTNRLARCAGTLALLSACSAATVSCGGSPGSHFTGGESLPDGATVDIPDASMGASDASNLFSNDVGVVGCVPKTCQDLAFNCGSNSDGCGGVLQCGDCPAGEVCGGGGYSVCGPPGSSMQGDASSGDGGSSVACVPETCQSLGYDCGQNGDGCGNVLDCGTCASPAVCGGGGFSKCGSFSPVSDAGVTCTPTTCQALGYTCGPAPDGCGNLLQCGTCTAPETCGSGGFNKCGLPPGVSADGGSTSMCTPATCSSLDYDCGYASDGCGNLLTCGTCTAPETCGSGGFNKCGLPPGVSADGGSTVSCTPTTCAAHGYDCGQASDGCGLLLQCGTCPAGESCGLGGFDTCGTSAGGGADATASCTPLTCQSQGITCGPAGDGCGHVLSCGSCTSPQSCGGGTPGQCGCTGLCGQLAACPANMLTTVTGTVRAGQSAWTGLSPDPVPNALVYVPNAGLSGIQAFSQGASCRSCSADVSGSPLVSAYTNFDGTFTLSNVPAGSAVPVVVQLGRWRRKFTFNVPSCQTTALGTLNLPRNKNEGDIPLTAVSTGQVDPLECVLLKMGVDQAEFTPSTGTGRIHIYGGGPAAPNSGQQGLTMLPGVTAGTGTRNESALLGSGGTFQNYDQILLPCWGGPATKTSAELANLISYADNGGHFFATHYSYSWLVGNGEFNGVAKWNPQENSANGPWTLNVSKSVPPSPPAPNAGTFAEWLNFVKALSNSGTTLPNTPQVAITNPRHDADSVIAPTVDWIDGTDPVLKNALVEHFTFDTPVSGSTCGHAIFSDFHVSQIAGNKSSTNGLVFPNECTKTFTAQEKILEYMIFDLASCAQPLTPACNPLTCQQQNIGCGPAGDGCGNQLNCGTCTAPLTCGGGGTPGQCGTQDAGSCQPTSCQAQGFACGETGDGCGNTLDCGTCPTGQSCVQGQCVSPDAGSGCVASTCAQQSLQCGQTGDGCGNVIDCGTCPAGSSCVAGQCVTAPDAGSGCIAATCAQQSLQCGPAGDGCGNAIDCGPCPTGSSCISGQCVAPDAGGGCVPATCAQQNLQCGAAGDGCGSAIDCGPCPAGSSCLAGQCVAPDAGGCAPSTCASQNITCGYTGDGCGNLLDCGQCVAPMTCGGGGTPGQCGGGAQ